MSPSVALIVLAAAWCHALWNTLIKAQPNPFAGLVVLLGVTSLLSAMGVLYYGAPPRESWGYVAVSVVLHLAYNNFLALSYRLGDISLVYPVIRGSAMLLATAGGFFWLAETPPFFTMIGILVVSAGILCMIGRHGNFKTIAAALLTACTIASYSVADALGVRATGNAVQYACWVSIFDGPFFLLLMIAKRGGRPPAMPPPRHALMAVAGGVLCMLAYGLVIHAYTMAQVGAVAALRETSVLFGALMGMVFLGEPKSRARMVGAAVIAAGTAMIVVNSA